MTLPFREFPFQWNYIPNRKIWSADFFYIRLHLFAFKHFHRLEAIRRKLTKIWLKRAMAVNKAWCIDYKPWNTLCLLVYCILFHGLKMKLFPVLCKVYVSVWRGSSRLFFYIVKSTESWGLFICYHLLLKKKSMQYEVCIQDMETLSASLN